MKLAIILSFFLASTLFAQTPDWRPINRVYKDDAHVVGSVGSAGQIKAGHVLTTKSFPASVLGNDKLTFWNLASASDNSGQSSCTSGAAACDLTNNGTVTFTGADLWNTGRIATFNGSTQYLRSTDAFFNPLNQSFSFGGWFYTSDWTPTPVITLMSNNPNFGGDAGWQMGIQAGTGNLTVGANASSGTGFDNTIFYNPYFTDGSWHHIAVVFDYAAGSFSLFVDGTPVASAKQATIRQVTSPAFTICANNTTPSQFFNGSVQDVFFARAALTAQDIRRLYSTRLDHNKNLIAKRQDWHFKRQLGGVAGNPYQSLPFLWYDSTDSNSLFIDLSDLGQNDRVDLRLYDLQQ